MDIHVTTMNLLHCSLPRSVGVNEEQRTVGQGGSAMIAWIHGGPRVTAAFLGSLVECVEAVTIVLAVGTVRGWRSALLGAAGGLAVLTALVVGLGPALAVLPLTVLQLVIALLLLLFRLSWLRQAALRAAGSIPVHDERRAVERATALLAVPGLAAAAVTASLLLTARSGRAGGRGPASGRELSGPRVSRGCGDVLVAAMRGGGARASGRRNLAVRRDGKRSRNASIRMP